MKDEIVLESLGTFDLVPVEPASDKRFVKHVRLEGARFHVLWWDYEGTHCSESRCIVNKDHIYP